MSEIHDKGSDLEKGDASESYKGPTNISVLPSTAAELQGLHDDVPRNKKAFAGVSTFCPVQHSGIKHPGSCGDL